MGGVSFWKAILFAVLLPKLTRQIFNGLLFIKVNAMVGLGLYPFQLRALRLIHAGILPQELTSSQGLVAASLTKDEIEEFMRSQGVYSPCVILADESYSLPSLEWMRGRFCKALRNFFRMLRIFGWKAEKFDCDDFARGAAFFASVLHHISIPEATGLAVGEFHYRTDSGEGHAVNVQITRENGILQLSFFEPQRVLKGHDPIVRLTQTERALCHSYRF